ncbi:MAG: hypothetical protein AAFV19_03455 [Pseudomonadota bacterium]
MSCTSRDCLSVLRLSLASTQLARHVAAGSLAVVLAHGGMAHDARAEGVAASPAKTTGALQTKTPTLTKTPVLTKTAVSSAPKLSVDAGSLAKISTVQVPAVTAASLDISKSAPTESVAQGTLGVSQTNDLVVVSPVSSRQEQFVKTDGGNAEFVVDFTGDGLTRFEVDTSSGVSVSGIGPGDAQRSLAAISQTSAENVRTSVVSIGSRAEGQRIRLSGGLIRIDGPPPPGFFFDRVPGGDGDGQWSYTPAIDYNLAAHWKDDLLKMSFAPKPHVVDDWYSNRGNDALWGLR